MEISIDELAGRVGDPTLALIDVRTEAEYSGAAGYPCDPRQGHIPGARHLDVAHLVECSLDELRDVVRVPEGAEVVTYCHSGSRSAHAAELLRAAGFAARNYVGSWHEWSRRDELPVE